eukprot:1561107-Rhodomonas_salina.6
MSSTARALVVSSVFDVEIRRAWCFMQALNQKDMHKRAGLSIACRPQREDWMKQHPMCQKWASHATRVSSYLGSNCQANACHSAWCSPVPGADSDLSWYSTFPSQFLQSAVSSTATPPACPPRAVSLCTKFRSPATVHTPLLALKTCFHNRYAIRPNSSIQFPATTTRALRGGVPCPTILALPPRKTRGSRREWNFSRANHQQY